MIIGTGTFMFQGFTQVAATAEFSKSNIIPTSYANYTDEPYQAIQNNLPEGYKKANYTIGAIDLEYYHNQKPTDKDIAKENAAEIGAQALWNIFDLNLENQVIEMGYQQATEGLPRSNWYADVLINGERSYYFSVDSITGELFGIGRSRTLDVNVSVAFDPVLDKNPEEYNNLAKELAEKYNVVHGAVKNAEYNGQGYSDNDPTISIDITGINGEIALISLSRYDKALLGIGYYTEYKYVLEHIEKIEKEARARNEERKKSAMSSDINQIPSLEAID
jgi:hypothetical protein